MHSSLESWMLSVLSGVNKRNLRIYYGERLLAIERSLRLDLGKGGAADRFATLLSRTESDGELYLEVLHYLLHQPDPGLFADTAYELETILKESGSAWRLAMREGNFGLERRVDASVIKRAESTFSSGGRAGQHLELSWKALYSRSPDPSSSYREAVRAIEAAGKPIILPNDNRATLGKMIQAIRDAPTKWETDFGVQDGTGIKTIRSMCALVWTDQLDRHGTDDESIPLQVTSEQAEAALHIALTLTHLFTSGRIRLS